MSQYEEQIRKERTFEAIRKNLMGKSGKVSAIAMIMGSPMIADGGSDMTFMDKPWEDMDDNAIPYFGDSSSYLRGWIWDGLREGIHMEIKVDGYCDEFDRPDKFILSEIKVSFEGYPVYHESSGTLQLYTPKHPIVGLWEGNIDRLYERALTMRKRNVKLSETEEKAKEKSFAAKMLEKLTMKWGD